MTSGCPDFDECNAPLCPYDEQSVASCAWFPDEEICRRQKVPEWAKRQRRIAKKLERDWTRGSFTVRMLQRRCKITSAMRGANPDKGPATEQEEKWLQDHPELEVRQPSEAQLEAQRKFAAEAKKNGGFVRET